MTRPSVVECQACRRKVEGDEAHIATYFVPLGAERWMRNCRSCMHFGVKSRGAPAPPATTPQTSGEGTASPAPPASAPAAPVGVGARTEQRGLVAPPVVAASPARRSSASAGDPSRGERAASRAPARSKEKPPMGRSKDVPDRQGALRAALADGPKHTAELCKALGWSRVQVGNGLQALKRNGLVETGGRGTPWTLVGKRSSARPSAPPSAPPMPARDARGVARAEAQLKAKPPKREKTARAVAPAAHANGALPPPAPPSKPDPLREQVIKIRDAMLARAKKCDEFLAALED